MAKQNDDDSDDGLPPIGEGTADFLVDAKKGKPRNFLLICKGSKVKYLIVKKKPIKKGDIAEAKKLGYKGDACIGVITGSGMQLVFNLAIFDGYDAEPCSDKKLKDFLAEHADFKCQPSFAIVATPPEVPFDEEDLAHPLVDKFLKLKELENQVSQKVPDSQQEIKASASEIRDLLQVGNFNVAEPLISQHESRLKQLLEGGSVQSAPPPPPAYATQADDPLKQKLSDALNKLVPQIKQLVATYPERKVELLTPVAEVKKQLDAGQLQEARQGILAIGQLLKDVLASGNNQPQVAPSVNEVNSLRGEYENKLASLLPQYEQALKNQWGDGGKFRAVMAYLTEQAEAGIYEKAIAAIDRLSQAVGQAVAAGAIQPQPSTSSDQPSEVQGKGARVMAFKRARLEWAMACDSVNQQIRQLKGAILQASAELGANELSVIDASTDQLYSILGDLARELQDRFDENLGALETADQQLALEGAVRIMDDYIDFINSNPLTDAAEKNPFGVPVAVRNTLSGKLTDLKAEFLRAIA